MTNSPETPDDQLRRADHEARQRAAAIMADATNPGVPMWDAVVALDTLAIMAGIPAPGSVHIDPEASRSTNPPLHGTREQIAASALRRCAAWAKALVEALPEPPA